MSAGCQASPPAVFLMGPTASGKSDLAVALAERFPFEIVSVDSALVYRGMDIGTAKPPAALRARIPHHLIDIRDPAQAYSAAAFRREALSAIDDIHARGKVALLAGGTMLYFRALERGLSALPESQPAVRAELEQRLAGKGSEALHGELARVDPDTAARVHPNDPQRILRALEVFEITGQPMSRLIAQQPAAGWNGPLLKLAVLPADRGTLHDRIAARFDAMLAAGFVDEVAGLRARGDLHPDMPSMRSVGYRQVWRFLDGEYEYARMRERGVVATRQLAKRQMTWLRSEPDLQILDMLNYRKRSVSEQISRFLEHVG